MKLPRGTSAKNRPRGRGYLDGQMLIAMPAMLDERFARSLIYICAHSSEGAMAFAVNHPPLTISSSVLLGKLTAFPPPNPFHLPSGAAGVKGIPAGPVETHPASWLHSP